MAVPALQHLFFLLVADPEPSEEAAQLIARSPRGERLPRAVRELYATVATIPMAADEHERTLWNEPSASATIAGRVTERGWTIPLPALFAEYWDGELRSLADVLAGVERVLGGGRDPELEGVPDPEGARGPLVFIQTDVMRQWQTFVELDGSDDPPLHERSKSGGWQPARAFSRWLFRMFADAYVAEDWVPRSFWGPEADLDRSAEAAPVQPFKNGLWLRGSGGPLGTGARDALAARFDHDARPWGSRATLHRFTASESLLWIVADETSSAWWMWAESEQGLGEVARAAVDVGRLDGELVADTDDAGAVVLDLGRAPPLPGV